MIVLSGAGLVLPDRVLAPGTLVIDGERIVEIRPGEIAGEHSAGGADESSFSLRDHFVVPGFIDVHLHGVDGIDSLDGSEAVRSIAARLPRCGVASFCPTAVACPPTELRCLLEQVAACRESPAPDAARVLPAHLESNFINPAFRGAQPAACLRSPRAALDGRQGAPAVPDRPSARDEHAVDFAGGDVLAEIQRASSSVGIVTIAPELDGGLDLVSWLVSRGHRVSLGHSGASYDAGLAAIAAGARHATHLFNRMPPLDHHAPGLVGSVLQSEEVAAELVCDGFHVHPVLMRTAIRAKGPSRVMAITDGTAAAGLPIGGRVRLGGRTITARESGAFLDDGTLAGSVLTMDRAFQLLVRRIGLGLVEAAVLCSTTPARELGLNEQGVLAPGAIADLAVLDSRLEVVQTYIAGHLVYRRA